MAETESIYSQVKMLKPKCLIFPLQHLSRINNVQSNELDLLEINVSLRNAFQNF